ncbi:hypothetical protein [Sphingomonas sp.]|uniref:hypothetical protein n=1 Tax=Sphingomonas sp. TaxID=28214 RepID=UPI003F703B68
MMTALEKAAIARWRWRLTVAFLVGWAVSLALPALKMDFDGGPQTFAGYRVLASGWVGLAYFQFGWLANLALVAVLVGLSTHASRRWMTLWAFALLAFTACTVDLWIRPRFNQHAGFGSGYFLWVIVNVGAAAASLAFSSRRLHLP